MPSALMAAAQVECHSGVVGVCRSRGRGSSEKLLCPARLLPLFVDFVHARQRNLTLDDLIRLDVFPFLDDQSKIYYFRHVLSKYQASQNQ